MNNREVSNELITNKNGTLTRAKTNVLQQFAREAEINSINIKTRICLICNTFAVVTLSQYTQYWFATLRRDKNNSLQIIDILM